MIVAYVMITKTCPARHVHIRTITVQRQAHPTIHPIELASMTLRADRFAKAGVL
jgi:hypothetical protein